MPQGRIRRRGMKAIIASRPYAQGNALLECPFDAYGRRGVLILEEGLDGSHRRRIVGKHRVKDELSAIQIMPNGLRELSHLTAADDGDGPRILRRIGPRGIIPIDVTVLVYREDEDMLVARRVRIPERERVAFADRSARPIESLVRIHPIHEDPRLRRE